MFTITILMRENGSVSLVYDGQKRATEEFNRLVEWRRRLDQPVPADEDGLVVDDKSSIILLADDFGTQSDIDVIDVTTITLQDVKRVNEGGVELQLCQQRAQAQLMTKMRSDPSLKFMNAGQAGNFLG
jgi:hypothetical protein